MSKDQDREGAGDIRVISYAGHRAEELPRRFYLGQREINVAEIIDRWLDPLYRYFKLRGDDGGVYILRHNVKDETWAMTMFDAGTRDETRLSST